MAVSDDVREAIASLKKITDTIDKITAVERDIRLVLATTKFSYANIRSELDGLVVGLVSATDTLNTRSNNLIKQISLAQGGP